MPETTPALNTSEIRRVESAGHLSGAGARIEIRDASKVYAKSTQKSKIHQLAFPGAYFRIEPMAKFFRSDHNRTVTDQTPQVDWSF